MINKDISVFESVQSMKNPDELRACVKAHGLYHNKHFVLRLSPLNHENMKKIAELNFENRGVVLQNEIPIELLYSYATYIHENIHWWQHKGSICGMLRSMAQLSFSHINLDGFRELYEEVGGIKPLFKWWHNLQNSELEIDSKVDALANNIINNFVDIEFYLLQSYSPQNIRELRDDPYYISPEHSTFITYQSVLNDIADTIDKEGKIFPHLSEWSGRYEKEMERRRQEGTRMEIHLSPIGLIDILEGQARMIQLQYLRNVLGENSLVVAQEDGYLNREYGKALLYFLDQLGEVLPSEVDTPLVALFLLVCDIALNPSEGFVYDIVDFNGFYELTDPGYRFTLVCEVIAKKLPHLKHYIKHYSKDEYIYVAEEICRECHFLAPHEISGKIKSWRDISLDCNRLMGEHETFDFSSVNLPTRLMLSEFISFNQDKAERPEFFCWPGIWLIGSRVSQDVEELWLSHIALYQDSGFSEEILPREMRGRDLSRVKNTFNQFYASVMMYNFLRQWILDDDYFDLSFKWLIDPKKTEELREKAMNLAEELFSIKVSDFEIFTEKLIGDSIFDCTN